MHTLPLLGTLSAFAAALLAFGDWYRRGRDRSPLPFTQDLLLRSHCLWLTILGDTEGVDRIRNVVAKLAGLNERDTSRDSSVVTALALFLALIAALITLLQGISP
jgi:hypothetical protein